MAISTSHESNNTLRNRLIKSIVLAIRNIYQKSIIDDEGLDLIAFIIIALIQINKTVEQSATAWEKRNYWIKADKFRLEWVWAIQYANTLEKILHDKNWGQLGECLVGISQKLKNITISSRNRIGEPWKGAYKIFNNL